MLEEEEENSLNDIEYGVSNITLSKREVNDWDGNTTTTGSNWKESNTTVKAGGWNTPVKSDLFIPVINWEKSNTTVAKSDWDIGVSNLKESNTIITVGGWNTPIRNIPVINWEESTGLEESKNFIIKQVESNYRSYERDESDYRKSYERDKKFELEKRQIIEIVRHLADNNNYKVYGYWVCHQWQCEHKPQCSSMKYCERRDKMRFSYKGECKHKPQCQNETECQEKCYRRKWQCENSCNREWRKQYDQELLKKYLEEIPKRPLGWLGLFIRICEKHSDRYYNTRYNKGKLISSFLLYESENSDEKPDMEVICHLVWNNNYRVFGNWKCSHCQKKWRSAYTWISLQKFIEKGKHLKGDYIMQKCKKQGCGNDGIILSYKPLVQSEDGIKHKEHLCAKCLHGEVCHESGTYYGYQN